MKRFELTRADATTTRIALISITSRATSAQRATRARSRPVGGASGTKLNVFRARLHAVLSAAPMDGDPRPDGRNGTWPTTDAFAALARELGIVIS